LSTRLLLASIVTTLIAAVIPAVTPTPVAAASNVSGVINTYQAVSTIAGDVVTVTGSTAGSVTPFANGDSVMLIQMTGAPPAQPGSTTGVYEIRVITDITGSDITVDGITRGYDTSERVQLVRVPTDGTGVTVTGAVFAEPWDGTTGGVIALAGSTLTMTADIDGTGAGFTNNNAPGATAYGTTGFGDGVEGIGFDGLGGLSNFEPGVGGGGTTGGGGPGGSVPPSGGGNGGGPGQGGAMFGVTPIASGVDGAGGAVTGAFGGGTGAGGGGGIIGGGGGGAGLGGGAGGGTDGGGGGGAIDSGNVGGSGGGGSGGIGSGGDGIPGAPNFPNAGGNEGSPGGGGGSYGGGGGSGGAISGGDDGGGGGGGGSYTGGGAGGTNGWPAYGDGGKGNDAVSDPIPASAHYLRAGDARLLMGGPGGRGSAEAGSVDGGNGGSIIFLDFASIDGQSNAIRSNGDPGQSPPGGGAHSASGAGGAGQMRVVANSFDSATSISAVGGTGGTPTADTWHGGVSGGGGGGGGIWVQTLGAPSQAGATATVPNVSFDVSGGDAGPAIINPQDGQLTATSGAGGTGLISVSGVDYDLALTAVLKVGQTEPIAAGSDVVFTITVYNQGDAPVDSFSIIDYYPAADWTLSGSNVEPWVDNANGTATLAIAGASVPAGGTHFVDIVLTSPGGATTGVHTNWAEIAADNGIDLDSTPDTTNGGATESPLDGVIDNSGGDEDDHDPAPVQIAGTTGAIAVTNTIGVGDGSATTFEFTLTSSNCALPTTPFVLTTVGAGTVTFGGLASLVGPGGAACDYSVEQTNLASAWYPTTPNPTTGLTVSAGATTAVGFSNSVFDLALTVSTVTAGAILPGATATFEFDLVNQGGVDAFDITLTDYLPTLTTYSSSNAASVTTTANAAAVVVADNADGTLTIDTLAAGDSVAVEMTLLLDAAFGASSFTNWAEVSAALLSPAGTSAVDLDSTPNASNFSEPGETDDLADDDVVNENGKAGGDEDDHDPAVVTVIQPALLVRKYVQNAFTDPGFDPNDDASLGDDAQTPGTAQGIPLGADAVYRITVANTGAVHFANIVVDDAIAACAPLTRINAGDNDPDNLLAPGELWTFECALPDVLADVTNTATGQGTPVDPAAPGTPIGADVTDDDPAVLVTQPLSLGNEVFFDSNGDGVRDGGEAGIVAVQVQIWADEDEDGVPDDVNLDMTVDVADMVALTSTDGSGQWLVTGLREGKYLAIVPSSEWGTGEPLEGLHSSIDVGEEDSDNEDKGLDAANLGDAITTETIELIGTTEPTGESPDNDPTTPDDLENLTIDFGFTQSVTLGNRVFLDADNDGYRDDAEVGIPGVAVQVWLDADEDGAADDPTPVASVVTDVDGYYLVTNLSPNSYLVSIPASQFSSGGPLVGRASSTGNSPAPDPDTDDDRDDSGRDPAAVGDAVWSAPVTLGPGVEPTGETELPDVSHNLPFDANSNLTVDFGFYVLGGIGDAVFVDNNRNGVADAGEAFAAGVGVDLMNGAGATIASTTTDAAGRYTFDNLVAGTYQVRFVLATLPDGFIATTANAGVDDLIDSDANIVTGETGAITLAAGEWAPGWDLGIVDAEADISVSMSVSVPNESSLLWTITVTNNGPDPAPGAITVVDVLPPTLGYLSTQIINTAGTFACSAVGQVVTCIDPDGLAAGHVSTIEITTTVLASIGTEITNSASVSALGTETVTLNNSDEATITYGSSSADTTTTTSSGATTTTSAGNTTTTTPSGGTSPDGGSSLPATGSNLTQTLSLFAAALMIFGAMMAFIAERRREVEAGLIWVDEAKRPI